MRCIVPTFFVAVLFMFSIAQITPSLITRATTSLLYIADDPVFIGAGDIGSCPLKTGKYRHQGTKADATAQRVADLLPTDLALGVVFVAGDNAYGKGTAKQYAECYAPTWGRFKERTRPVPGNHEYIRDMRPKNTWFGRDYFDYFGETRAGARAQGYYSYEVGEWHIVALNSELRKHHMVAQRKWLVDDLKAHKRLCTLAYWHRPVFSSGEHGAGQSTPGIERTMQEVWRILDHMGVDVVINGHDHNYERFKAQDADGNADPNGITEFVVGTGGVDLREKEIPMVKRRNSAVFDKVTWGVLKLTLHAGGYDFEFIPVASKKPGTMFRDVSTDSIPCVE